MFEIALIIAVFLWIAGSMYSQIQFDKNGQAYFEARIAKREEMYQNAKNTETNN